MARELSQSCGRARIAALCLAFMVILLIIFAVSVSSSSPSPESFAGSMSRLREDLFKKYDKSILPVLDAVSPVQLHFGLSLLKIDMEEDGTVVLHTWLRCIWKDFRLQWDPSSYGNVRVLRIPADQIWIPDITIFNENEMGGQYLNKSLLGRSDVNYVLNYNGEVHQVPPATIKSHCLNVTSHGLQKDWPWGEHMCHFKFGSWSYDASKINITRYNNQPFVDLSNFVRGPVQILGNSFTRHVNKYKCCEEPYISLHANLTIRKLYTVLGPGKKTTNPRVEVEDVTGHKYEKWIDWNSVSKMSQI